MNAVRDRSLVLKDPQLMRKGLLIPSLVSVSSVDGQRGLRVMCANVQSLNNKVNELRALATLECPDVIALTETWTNESIANECLHVEGYDVVVRKDRTDTAGGRGGGIVVYVKDVFAWQKDVETNFNQCALIKVKRRGRDLGLGIVYR